MLFRSGVASPSDLAASVMRQLANGGVVRRGTLGVETQDVDERIAASLGLDSARGAAVTRVYAGSAAEKAGLEPGDVIVGANGQRIDDGETLRNFQGLQAPDAKVTLDVRRAGRSDEHTTELQTLMRNSYAVFCLKK